MATNKECKCLESTVRIVGDATILEEFGMVMMHHGDLKFEPKKGEIIPPEKNLSGLINRHAKDLKDTIPEFLNSCSPKLRERWYKEGVVKLDKVIESKGKDASTSFIAGSNINDFIQDNVINKKLISCKD